MAAYSHLYDEDGWNKETFEDVLWPLRELNSLQYEIENCVHNDGGEEMIDRLRDQATELLEAINNL